MPQAFTLVETPHVTRVEGFTFAFERVRGAYQPWERVRALDAVALALEQAGIPRTGPAFGIYYDLPESVREPEEWIADLGYPIPRPMTIAAVKKAAPGLKARRFNHLEVAKLRYDGDLGSFPPALSTLMEWVDESGLEPAGPLVERFYVSDAMTGREERDVMLALDPIRERVA